MGLRLSSLVKDELEKAMCEFSKGSWDTEYRLYLGLTFPLTIKKRKKYHYILLIQPSMITDRGLNMQKGSRDLKMQKTNILLLTRSKLQYNMPSSYTTSKNKVLGVDSRVNHQFCLGAGRWKCSRQRITPDLGLES